MKLNNLLGLLVACTFCFYSQTNAQEVFSFDELMKGNERFRANITKNHDYDALRLKYNQNAPQPAVIVVCDADARMVPEIIFDCTLGDIYVVRVGGTILDESALGTIEYALQKYNSRTILLMGNLQSDLIDDAMNAEGEQTFALASIYAKLSPAINEVKNKKYSDIKERKKTVVINNIKNQLKFLRQNNLVQEMETMRRLELVPCYYDAESNTISTISEE